MNDANYVPMVSPNGRYELLEKKLESFKIRNLNAKELKEINNLEHQFASIFLSLCWSYEGLSNQQVAELGEEDIKCLAEAHIEAAARKHRILKWFLLISSPMGWLIFLLTGFAEDVDCIAYFRRLKKIKKIYGNDYFPSSKILEIARQYLR